ncbi:MAG TPA: hypothetical protein VEZ42_22675 [Pseudonocardia sp.]|nr:hypothetical protein [Pseudonocardia sp.]
MTRPDHEEIEMPTLPWTTARHATAADGEALVMASRFQLRSFRHVLPFLRDAMRVRALVRRSEGALGVSLVARPLHREFRTLSAWRDRAALDAMVRTEPHRSVMGRYHRAMTASAFVFYTPQTYPPTWAEAEEQLLRSRA